MAITKKPKASEVTLPEADIQALIEKGGSVASQGKKEQDLNKPQLLQLRLDRELLVSIDAVIHKRKVKIPRHTWILEALHEKLEHEIQSEIKAI